MPAWEPIEGETPIDPSGLKIEGIHNRRELSEVEARNILSAALRYLAAKPQRRTVPFDFGWCLTLHGEMFGNVWEWAGEIRAIPLNLGVPHHRVRDALRALLEDLHSWSGFGHSMEDQAVWLHHRSVEIHPFRNGNGRWARMLSNIWLFVHDHPVVLWPDDVIGSASVIRGEYLAALRSADEGDYEPLAELHGRYAQSATDEGIRPVSDQETARQREPWRDLCVGDHVRLIKLPPDYDDLADFDEPGDSSVQDFYRDLLESGRLVTVTEIDSGRPRATVPDVNEFGVPGCHDFPVDNDAWELVEQSS